MFLGIFQLLAICQAISAAMVDPLLVEIAAIKESDHMGFISTVKAAMCYETLNSENIAEVYKRFQSLWLNSRDAEKILMEDLIKEVRAYMTTHKLWKYISVLSIHGTPVDALFLLDEISSSSSDSLAFVHAVKRALRNHVFCRENTLKIIDVFKKVQDVWADSDLVMIDDLMNELRVYIKKYKLQTYIQGVPIRKKSAKILAF